MLGCRGGILLEPPVVSEQGRAVDRRRDEVAGLEWHRVQHRLRDIVANQARRSV